MTVRTATLNELALLNVIFTMLFDRLQNKDYVLLLIS